MGGFTSMVWGPLANSTAAGEDNPPTQEPPLKLSTIPCCSTGFSGTENNLQYGIDVNHLRRYDLQIYDF